MKAVCKREVGSDSVPQSQRAEWLGDSRAREQAITNGDNDVSCIFAVIVPLLQPTERCRAAGLVAGNASSSASKIHRLGQKGRSILHFRDPPLHLNAEQKAPFHKGSITSACGERQRSFRGGGKVRDYSLV